MFILHSMGIASPADMPTPRRFAQRLVRLVYGPAPSIEIVQLMRCLRVLPEQSGARGSDDERAVEDHFSAAVLEDGSLDGSVSLHGLDGLDGGSTRLQSETTGSDTNARARVSLRSVLHDDESATAAERWQSAVMLLLRFPILVQPAVALQRALTRKTLGQVRF